VTEPAAAKTQKAQDPATIARRLGCVALCLFGAVCVSFGWGAWALFNRLGFEKASPIVAGVATALVSLFSFLLAKHLERQREVEQELRKSKVVLYETFIAFWLRVMMSGKPGIAAVKDEELQQFFATTTQQLIVWASDDVFREYVRFRAVTVAGIGKPDSSFATGVAFGRLLLSIRRDMGHSNKGIAVTDVLATFINDVEKFPKA
jgi:hypothetical protein